jgi:hypothetical protein
MATIHIDNYFDFGVKTKHNGSSWQIALDSDFKEIIDESLDDKINVKSWNSKLPKLDGVGYYKDLSTLYARVKVHIDNTVSPWFVLPVGNQNDQTVIVTEVDGSQETYNSLEMGLN